MSSLMSGNGGWGVSEEECFTSSQILSELTEIREFRFCTDFHGVSGFGLVTGHSVSLVLVLLFLLVTLRCSV